MRKSKLCLLFIFMFLLQFIIFSSPSFAKTDDLNTYSPACILIDSNTGKVLYEKNSNTVRYPASTTKIMTAILAVENCKLDDLATVSHNAIFSVPYGYSHASLKENEQLTIEQLLNVLLIPSANDAANVLAEHISGTIEDFANLMNQKAKEIGCLNTHFVNPNGVHNKEHTTTAYDLALMGKYAMQYDKIREIVRKTQYKLPATSVYTKSDRIFNNTNDLILENHSSSKSNYYYPNAIGIKTGYTSEAGCCIIAGAKKNNMEVIAVVLGGDSTKDGLSERYLDCKNLFNYAFNNYSLKTVQTEGSLLKQIVISGASSDTKDLNVLVKNNISILLNNEANIENLEPEIIFNENLKAPISANSVVGTISYTVDGVTYSSELIAGNEVIASDFMAILFRVLLIFVTLYLLYLLVKPSNRRYHRKGKKGGNYKFTQLKNI